MRISSIFCLVAVVCFGIQVSGCMSTTAKPSGYLSEYNFKPGEKGGVDRIWVANGLDGKQNFRSMVSRYSKIIIDPVQLAPGRSTKQKSFKAYDGVKPEQVREMADMYHRMLVEVFSPKYQIVTTPGPGVLRISTALTGLEAPNPLMSAFSTFGLSSMAVSVAKKAIVGEHTSVGSASMELKLLDAHTGRALLAVMDRKAGEKDLEKISDPLRDSKKALVWWAEWLRSKMDAEYEVALQQKRAQDKTRIEAAAKNLNKELQD